VLRKRPASRPRRRSRPLARGGASGAPAADAFGLTENGLQRAGGRRDAAARDRGFLLVLVCFVLSGFAALLYQTAWTRQFAFVFGTSELAVATVLAAYMGGLAAGAAVAGRLAPRIRRPVLAYGLLELGIGAAALAVPAAIGGALHLAVALFGGVPEPPDAAGSGLPLFFLAASFAILIVPTALMGATLPLLARHAVRSERELGPRIALLYGLNTAGAVLGTVSAAFLLLPSLGLRGTVLVGAGTNAAVFGLAVLVARHAPALPAPAGGFPPGLGSGWRVWGDPQRILVLMAISGAVSFVYEVLWARLLGHVLGGTVHAFATMLASFLAGIALGSAIAARRAGSPETAARTFGGVQIGIALASLAAYACVDRLPQVARALDVQAGGSLAAAALLAGAVLLPGTLFIGATFPLAVRILARSEHDAGPTSARVYAWNTLGAILGAVGGGFFLVPALGYAGTMTLCVATGLLLAVVAGAGLAPGSGRTIGVASLLLLGLALVRPGSPEVLLRSSPLGTGPMPGEMVYLGIGRSATVTLIDRGRHWRLRSNGLPEAAILPSGREMTGRGPGWLAALASLARPELRSLLVVGFGGGVVLERLPEGLERVDAVELEPEVIEANRAVADRRARDPLRDPRLRIHLNDARGALLLTERRWDAVVSQPSHPWTSGASHLYTREFFELVREHLRPGGVFVQWMGPSYVDEPLARSLVATLSAVFPHVRVYHRGILIFVASEEPLRPEANAERARRGASQLLDATGLVGPEELAARLVLDEEGVRRFGQGAPLITDDRNLLQMHARRALRDPLERDELWSLLEPLDPLVPPDPGLDPVLLVRELLETGQFERARRAARATPGAPERRVARALVRSHADPAAGERELEALLAERPGASEVRKALLLRQLRARDLPDGARRLARPLGEPALALVEAWESSRAGRWERVRELDPVLARIDRRDTLFAAGTRLRIGWRLEAGDPARAAEALALADRLVPQGPGLEHRLLRARAAAATGAVEAALGDLEALVGSLRRQGAKPAHAERVLAALDELPREPGLARRMANLESRIRRLARSGGRPAAGISGDGWEETT